MDFPEVATAVRGFLAERGYPFAVVGGLALHAYGASRATFDLDLVTDGAAQKALVGFLEARGYRTLHRSPGFSNHQHEDPRYGRLDVIYVRGATRDALFAVVEERPILRALTAPVPRPEHLIAMKLHALRNDPERRLQELADIRALIEVGAVEEEAVREVFADRGMLDLYEEVRRQG